MVIEGDAGGQYVHQGETAMHEEQDQPNELT